MRVYLDEFSPKMWNRFTEEIWSDPEKYNSEDYGKDLVEHFGADSYGFEDDSSNEYIEISEENWTLFVMKFL